MPYLPPAQTTPRWLSLLVQLLAAVVTGFVLISVLPFLLLFAGIGAVILLVALRIDCGHSPRPDQFSALENPCRQR